MSALGVGPPARIVDGNELVVALVEVCCGFEIAVDIDQNLTAGQRFQDKRPVAKAMWETIMAALETVGALPQRLRA